MNYQHAFHAGNFADVHKHVVLTRILDYLRQKPAAFRVIDSHAGAGRYDLAGPQAMRSPEWRDGIGRLVAAMANSSRADALRTLLSPYLDAIAAFNPVASGRTATLDTKAPAGITSLRFYPGSPLIARALLRPQDRLIACEVEPRAAAALKAALHGDRRAKVLAIDGWTALNANVPPKERRGLVVIDPPFEEADDFAKLPTALAAAHRKWPTGIYMLWFPIKEREAPDALARRLRSLAIAKLLRSEIALGPPQADSGLIGSGLIVVNPPYTLERELTTLQPGLARMFSTAAVSRLDWLAREQRGTAGDSTAKKTGR